MCPTCYNASFAKCSNGPTCLSANGWILGLGTMKLCDFGLSLPGVSDQAVAGTPAYMPPESLRLLQGLDSTMNRLSVSEAASATVMFSNGAASGEKRRLFAIDVYAMGIILWEIFTELPLYDGLSVPNILDAVLSGKRFV